MASRRLAVLGPSGTAGRLLGEVIRPRGMRTRLAAIGNTHDGGAALTMTAWFSRRLPGSARATQPNVPYRRDLWSMARTALAGMD